MAAREFIQLGKWHFKRADDDDDKLLPCAQFPTNIHLDLLHHRLIPDPFIGKNELNVQWVGETKWTYTTTFQVDDVKGKTASLSFEGLDTFATVIFNGKKVLESDNMFIPYRVDVSELLKSAAGESNVLTITFGVASERGWELVKAHPEHKWECWNGDNSRLPVRKAQYHFGWDWGPRLVTCGPWRPITLELYQSRFEDLSFDIDVPKSLASATVKAFASVEGNGKADRVHFEVFLEAERVSSADADIAASHSTAEFHIQKPNLWYPIRYGKQPLYTVIATLFSGNDKLDTITKRIGLRRAELVQHALQDQPGTSFFFKINNIPIFCGGSNWIPADSFVPRITAQKYRDWIQMVADGNQSMVRVWGGGIYEEQVFYDTCDELGILVWQDFLFGCGNYGVWDDFVTNVQKEAEENIKRLRHHPCMVIWAGNNEDYQVQESMGLHYDFSDKNVDNWLKSDFPARYIYEKVLADACKKLIPSTYYHYGSPWGAGKDTKDPTVGDIHQWNVWHGTQEPYQDFDKLSGRFVSEFGMEAFPDIKTIDGYLPKGKDDPDRYAQSSTVDFHNKAAGHERRLALYLAENIRYSSEPLEAYVYFTQLMQAECLSFAYRLFKRQWKGPEREYCAGVLVWQINDCWPVTSWAICDYNLRPKMAYYAVKRELAPFTVGIKRTEDKDRPSVEVWACNLTTEDVKVEYSLQAWNLETGEEIFERMTREALLKANRTTELLEKALWEAAGKQALEGKTVVQAALYRGNELLASFMDWPQPLKYCHFPKADVKVNMVDDATVKVSSDSAIKGLVLAAEGVVFGDNCVDLAPGETVELHVLKGGKKGKEISYSHLGNMVG